MINASTSAPLSRPRRDRGGAHGAPPPCRSAPPHRRARPPAVLGERRDQCLLVKYAGCVGGEDGTCRGLRRQPFARVERPCRAPGGGGGPKSGRLLAGALPIPARSLALTQLAGVQQRSCGLLLAKHVLELTVLRRLGHAVNVPTHRRQVAREHDVPRSADDFSPGQRERERLLPVEVRHLALLFLRDAMPASSREGEYRELAGDMTKLAHPPEEILGSQRALRSCPGLRSLTPRWGAIARSSRQARSRLRNYGFRAVDGAVKPDFEARVVPCGDDEVVAIVRDVTDLRQGDPRPGRSPAPASSPPVTPSGAASSATSTTGRSSGSSPSPFTCISSAAAWRPTRRGAGAARIGPDGADAGAGGDPRGPVRGLHPRLLSDRGLGPALSTLAERAPPAGRDRRACRPAGCRLPSRPRRTTSPRKLSRMPPSTAAPRS